MSDQQGGESLPPEPTGTSACYICGKDTPHYHSPAEVEQHWETEAWVEESLRRFRELEAKRPARQPQSPESTS